MRSYQATEIQVGDLITVLLSETTQASRTSGVTTSRESTNDAIGAEQKDSIVNKLGFGTGFFTNLRTTGSTITSDGAGVAGQTASLTAYGIELDRQYVLWTDREGHRVHCGSNPELT